MTNVSIALKNGKTKTINNLLRITKNDQFSDPVTNFDEYSFTPDDRCPIVSNFIGKELTIAVAEKEIISVTFEKQD